MYRFVQFEDIEKDKWNGTVHYAPNGNPFGYYWYLKAVLKEWDAIVEDDYESVMPIITKPIYKEDYKLLTALGPYSVNAINENRYSRMTKAKIKHHNSAYYPLNFSVPDAYLTDHEVEKTSYSFLKTDKNYEDFLLNYNDRVRSLIEGESKDRYKILSAQKPEFIVAVDKLPNHYANALMRVMYNALHRGLGFSTGIVDKRTSQTVGVSFFIVSHNTLWETYRYYLTKEARHISLDLVVRNNAGRPMKIMVRDDRTDMGFLRLDQRILQTRRSFFLPILKHFGGRY